MALRNGKVYVMNTLKIDIVYFLIIYFLSLSKSGSSVVEQWARYPEVASLIPAQELLRHLVRLRLFQYTLHWTSHFLQVTISYGSKKGEGYVMNKLLKSRYNLLSSSLVAQW